MVITSPGVELTGFGLGAVCYYERLLYLKGKVVAELVAVDYKAPDAARQFVQSLRETGFGVLKNHPILPTTLTSMYERWGEFFAASEKENFLFDEEKFDGFFPTRLAETAKGHTVRDLKEYFHFYPWGRCPEALKNFNQTYYDQTVNFAAELLSWVEQHTPEDVAQSYKEPLSTMIQGSEQSLLRILHYPPLPQDREPDAIRASAHEDINLLTVLPAANEPGLQVLLKNGEWLDVPCDFGNLIINVGDMLQEASGGYFPSTTHRVVNPEGMDATASRISLPLFLHPRPDVRLSDRYTAGEYLTERLNELRKNDGK